MPKECSAKTAHLLYNQLEYYREYMPSILKWSEETYAATQEAKNVDAALQAYREETGEEPTYPPASPAKSALRSVLTALAILVSLSSCDLDNSPERCKRQFQEVYPHVYVEELLGSKGFILFDTMSRRCFFCTSLGSTLIENLQEIYIYPSPRPFYMLREDDIEGIFGIAEQVFGEPPQKPKPTR